MEKVGGLGMVVEGCCWVGEEEVESMKKLGGKLEGGMGIGEDELGKGGKCGVWKMNMEWECGVGMSGGMGKVLGEKGGELEGGKYVGGGGDKMEKV